MSAVRLAFALVPALALAACTSRPVRSPAGETARRAASSVWPAPELPRWRAIPVPPENDERHWWVETGRGHILVDESGVRWFFPHDENGAPAAVADVDRGPFEHRGYSSALGLLLFTPDDRVLATKTPLGAPEPIASLPKDADPKSFRVFRGGFTVRAGRQMLASRDGRSFRPVAPLAEHAFVELLLGADGRGLGLFAPGKVARTADDGATWQVLPTDDLTVDTLDEEQGRALLRPGGTRDRFARSVDLDDGKIARDPTPARYAPRRRVPRMRRSRPHQDETPLRPELYRGWLPGGRYWATDGDELALLGGGGVARGRIGEALHEKTAEEEDPCHSQELALCGDRLALGCAGHVRLSKGEAPPIRLQLPPQGVLGFDRRGALVIAYRTPEGSAVLRSHDLDDPNVFTERPVALSDADALTLTGGCHRAALWLSSSRSAQQIDPPRPGPAFPLPARVAPSTDKAPDDAEIVGVRADGELVVGTSQGLAFVPSGKTFSLGPAGADQVSFAEDGKHGLWRQDVGTMLQTADGGASWAPIPSPVAEHAMVICGATRCLLGGGAFLDGFVEAPAYVPAIRAAVAVRADEPAKLRCRPDPAPLPRDRGTLLALSPRLGTDLFAGLAGDPEMAPGSRRWAVFGARDRGLLTQALPRLASRHEAERGGLSEPSGTAGAIAVGRVDGGDDRRDRWTYLTTAKAAVGTTQLPLQSASWLSLDEVAEPTYPGRLIVWGKHAPEALPFRVPVRRPCPGVFGREPSGALLAAEICEGSLAVFARGLDGVQIDHDLVVRSGAAREDGVGLTFAGDAAGRGVFVLETTADGRPEIRFHALSDSLALGPGVPVPGTRGQPDGFVDLPSCSPEPTGAPMRLLARKPVRFTTGHPDVLTRGLVQRIARLTLSGGCIERTFVTDRPDLDASLVVAGNGGLAAEPSATVGLRCDPLDPSPE